MEAIDHYKEIAREVVDQVADRLLGDDSIQIQKIIDEKDGHYLVFNNGWRDGQHRIHGCVAHIEVRPDGKVWLHHDGTDLILAQWLLDRGVTKDNLVLGFHAPIMHADTEFAIS